MAVGAGVVTLMFFFVKGYFNRLKEDRKETNKKVAELDTNYDELTNTVTEINTHLKTLVQTQRDILEGQKDQIKDLARLDGQLMVIQKMSKDDSEKLTNALRDIQAIWRFADGSFKRASDSNGQGS